MMLYRGYEIIHTPEGGYDVRKDGALITQMAGPNGARLAVDCIYLRAALIGKTVRTSPRVRHWGGREGMVVDVLSSYDSPRRRPYLAVIVDIPGHGNRAFDADEVEEAP